MRQEHDVTQKDIEVNEVVSAIHKIASSIGEGKADTSIMDEEFFLELLNAGFDFEGNNVPLEKSFLSLYKDITSEQIDRKVLLCDLLRVLADNIFYANESNSKWISTLESLMNSKFVQQQYDVREMFMQQKNVDGSFGRWDTIVRYLAIEDYFGKNDYGFALYRKMQAARMGANYPEGAEVTYRKLIKSFDENGYDEESAITCDANLKLTDGSHRMALCLYYGIPKVNVKILKQVSNIEYGEKWFVENGFTEDEIEIIRNKCEELTAKCRQNFTCILWPPAAELFDEITEEINTMYPVVSYKDCVYSEETFERLVWGVYHIDDIADWKVEKKLSYMAESCPKKVRVVEVAMEVPDFRLKDATKQTLSKAGEKLKATIRSKFMERINNYFYDIIIHTGDNFMQNLYMSKLFEQAFSLQEYFERIEQYSYYVTKVDAPYQTSDFPNSYAFSKDLDVVCSEEDYSCVVKTTREFLQDQISGYEVVEIDNGKNYRFRVELKGYLIFQFDISAGVDGLSETFAKESLTERKLKNGYYLAQMSDELCIRALAYQKNPRKKHHLEYIETHADAWEPEKFEQALIK